MSRHPVSFEAMFSSLWRHRGLIRQLTAREIKMKYQGSALGLLWAFLNPLALVAIYTFVFGAVFASRWEHVVTTRWETAIMLLAGLIAMNFFSECLNRSCSLIISHPNYVKKAVFPLEILPWVSIGTALFQVMISFFILLALTGAAHQHLEPAVLLFPVLFLPFVLVVLGLTWAFSSLGVFLRDIGQFVPFIMTALLFLSPMFYPLSVVPEQVRHYYYLNPTTFVITGTRALILGGGLDWRGWGIYMVAGLAVAWAGFAMFQSLRKEFGNVL